MWESFTQNLETILKIVLTVSSVDSWPLMASPIPLAVIFAVYLWIVLQLGPKFMKTRQPFKLKSVIFIYNIFQILASIAVVSGVNFKWSFWNLFDHVEKFLVSVSSQWILVQEHLEMFGEHQSGRWTCWHARHSSVLVVRNHAASGGTDWDHFFCAAKEAEASDVPTRLPSCQHHHHLLAVS